MRLVGFAIFLLLLPHAPCYAISKTSLEPTKEDLNCFNDFDAEMKCHLSSDSVTNCSEYSINVTHTVTDTLKNYSCIFEQGHLSASDCECKINVPIFVVMEIFNTTLIKQEKKVLFSKKLLTHEFIKPKSPVLSVQKTENGNFKVTWDDMYKKSESSPFLRSLIIKLTYGIKGEHEKITTVERNSVKFYEIISKNLEAKTTYVLTANMRTEYNPHVIYSDESTAYEFTTPSSPNEQLIIIPIVCSVLIIIIVIVFILFYGIKRVWWDKISKPQINNVMGEHVRVNTLPPPFMSISPIRVDIPKLDLKEEKKGIVASLMDTNNETSLDNVDSAAVDYGQTCPGTEEDNNIIALTRRALDKVFNFPNKETKSPGTDFQKGWNCSNRDSGNCSGMSDFSNMAYFGTQTKDPAFQKLVTCDDYKTVEPNITNLLVSNNPMYPTVDESCMVTYDDGYQDASNLTKNTNSPTNTEIALGKCGAMQVFDSVVQSSGRAPIFEQSSWTSSLLITNIQIDDSYHPV